MRLPCDTESDREFGLTDITTGMPMVSSPVTLAIRVMPFRQQRLQVRESLGRRDRAMRAARVRLAVADGDAAVLQFQRADGDAVDIQHHVGSPLVIPRERLFSNREVVRRGIIPVDEANGLRDLACLDLYRDAVAQQAVDRVVVAVERAVLVRRLGAKLVQRDADLCRGVAAAGPRVSGST